MSKTTVITIAVILLCLPLIAKNKLLSKKPREIHVSSEEEFVNAIAPNTIIYVDAVEEGMLWIGTDEEYHTDYVNYEYSFDGMELVIRNVDNLSIIGNPVQRTFLVTDCAYSNVLRFESCSSISLKNLSCGHHTEGYCTGGVLYFGKCQNISIENCDLWGCGIEGITAYDCQNISCENSIIRDCSYSILTMSHSQGISFKNCAMHDNREYEQINFYSCKNVSFESCAIYSNDTSGCWDEKYLINVDNTKVSFDNCAIFNNKVTNLTNSSKSVTFNNCITFGNDYSY